MSDSVLERRIQEQKPTIQNKQFYKDRLRNIKYMKIIGKFPYDGRKSEESTFNLNSIRSIIESEHPGDVEVYRKQTDQFLIRILKISHNLYMFSIKVEGQDKVLQHTIKRQVYEDQLMKCGYNYEAMLGQLRLSDRNEISYELLTECLQPGANEPGQGQ